MKTLVISLSLVAVACSTTPDYGQYAHLAEQVNVLHDSALVAPDAPYLTERYFADDYMVKYAVSECGLSTNKADWNKDKARDCGKRHREAFNQVMSETYPLARGEEFSTRCTLEPKLCNEDNNFERWARASHNKHVELSRKAKLAELSNVARYEREAERAARMQTISTNLRALSEQLNGPRTTNCRITRDGLGGWNSVCD